MKTWLPAMLLAIATSLSLAPSMADAKRLGGGGSSGLQRSLPAAPPARPTPPANPQQAAPNTMPNPAGAAAAAAPKRSWLGPVAGLAAGIGLAALMSHLGLGAEFANFLMLALLAMVAFVAIRFVMARLGRPQPAAPTGRIEPAAPAAKPAAAPIARVAPESAAGAELSADGSTRLAPLGGGAPSAAALPAGFDAEGFARIAKTIFIRMQAANDAADLNDLRAFTTPEMFAVARLDIQDRGPQAQTTDVVQVDAEVLDVEQQGERQIVSVRFHGRIREEANGPVSSFDEVWHLQRWSHDPNWKIAGIQQQTVH